MARGLGMNVAAADPYASQSVAAAANVQLVGSLSELLPLADYLTIHTPMLASTRGMLSTAELNQMKRGARILNVARGGIVDEEALLAALESGQIAGAAIDVFTSEPPTKDPADTRAAKLIQHPRCIATPHLGASTVEAQENVSIDVCEQVLQILAGDLPRSAVNAPIILPAEYKTLQPFVRLVEKMGSLYTQHFTSAAAGGRNPTSFDLVYEGELAHMSSTKPLFAALIKGLTSPISDAEGFNVNIVNAEMVAKERGILVNEQKSRDPSTQAYSSLVTLVSRPAGSSSRASSPSLNRHASERASNTASTSTSTGTAARDAAGRQHIISGSCSDNSPIISRLDRFATSFVPDGTLLICHNFDSPGKIGLVGSILGREGVNINFMSVAPATFSAAPTDHTNTTDGANQQSPSAATETTEALMILGVDKEVGDHVKNELVQAEGVLSVSSVTL